MQAYRVETVVQSNGILMVENLPFAAGEKVELIILAQPHIAKESDKYPLRGTAYSYTDPSEPVAEDDWDALQ
ncbi:MAG: hypothetical protein ACREEM_33670 [Blastocatellia bacterium]